MSLIRVTLLLVIIVTVTGGCEFNRRFRGAFDIVKDWEVQGKIIVGQEKIIVPEEMQFMCVEKNLDTYLLKTQRGSNVLCLQFSDVADEGPGQFGLARRSADGENTGMFDPIASSSNMTVSETCTNKKGPFVYLRKILVGRSTYGN